MNSLNYNTKFCLLFCIIILTCIISGCTSFDASKINNSQLIDKTKLSPTSNELKVHFIDVGQGDCELIQYKNKNILVDAGESTTEKTVVAYLKKQKVTNLDYVIMSHPHDDHIGGMQYIISNVPTSHFVDAGYAHTTGSTYDKLRSTIEAHNIDYINVLAGDNLEVDPNIKMTILNPPEMQYGELNEDSIVFKLTYDKVSFLFTGDIDTKVEKKLLIQDIKSDVLKVAHHGSGSSSSAAFLSKVKPDWCVIDVGKNSYGHPKAETLKRLDNCGCSIKRTDRNGNIVMTTDGKTIY